MNPIHLLTMIRARVIGVGMPGTGDRYSLRGGAWGYDRLLLLSRERWPETSRFLTAVGLSEGMRCADLGCGAGTVTIEIAKRAGPSGRALGVDLDEVKLDLARKAAAQAGVGNVEFRKQAVAEWSEGPEYDLVYSRFLLQHLSSPLDAIRRMWGAVRPGGTLAVEDVDHGGWHAEPPSTAVDFLREGLETALRQYGGDSHLGRRLGTLFGEAGVEEVHLTKFEPHPFSEAGRMLPALTLESISDSLVAGDPSLAGRAEHTVVELRKLAEDPGTRVFGPTLYQVYARKSKPGG